MCYGYRPVYAKSGQLLWVSHNEYRRGMLKGDYFDPPHPFVYPNQFSEVISQGGEIESMYFDLIPRFFLKGEQVTLQEALKRKRSRKKNPATGKTLGFSSFNARFETVARLPSFRNAWNEGRRCVIPIDAFKERPNMDEAPEAMRNVEVTVKIKGIAYLGALWDEWRNRSGDTVRSFALITIDSSASALFRSIWHERMPVLLTEEEARQWIDSDTPLERIRELCDPYLEDELEIVI